MIDRFAGDPGRRLRTVALSQQKIVTGNQALAVELADAVELLQLDAGQPLIQQDADDNDIYFIIVGTFDVIVNGRVVGKRGPTDHVGEMAAIQPTQRRSASIVAAENGVVAKLSEGQFSEIAARYPEMYRHIAQELFDACSKGTR